MFFIHQVVETGESERRFVTGFLCYSFVATVSPLLWMAGVSLITGLAFAASFDSVNLASSGSAATADVSGSPYAIVASSASGGTFAATNYTINDLNGELTITPKDLAVSGISVADKVYDGTTTATLTGTAAVSALLSDDLSVAGTASASFADKNVATGKTVNVSGYTLGGADAGNYSIVQPTGLTANITPAALLVSGLTASNKIYDATTTATLGGTAAITALGSDDVSLGGTASGSFADKNVGDAKAVTVTGNSISGTDAGNYTLVQQTGLSADITAKAITVTADAQSKTYGNADPSLTYSFSTSLVGSDSFSGALSRAAGENVGDYVIGQNTLAISDGNSGNNYNLSYLENFLTILTGAVPKSIISSLTSLQPRVNSSQSRVEDNDDTSDGSNQTYIGPSAGSDLIASNFLNGLIIDKTGYRDEEK